jgi:arginyl-tRNA synthetase
MHNAHLATAPDDAANNCELCFVNCALNEKEVELIQKMNEFGAAVEQAGKDYSPSGIANYCYELTKVFNQFYHDYSILNEPDEQKKLFRLVLAKNVAKIIKNAMSLLGIEVPERM